jgi:N utilization substance protein B
MGTRRQAREHALSILYQVDISRTSPEEALGLFWKLEPADDDVMGFARTLVLGVATHRHRIDGLISDASTNWKLPRMSYVDRNILRLATFEIIGLDEVPPMVSVNEAIELGKRYGTTDSGSFINGILDRVARNLKVV